MILSCIAITLLGAITISVSSKPIMKYVDASTPYGCTLPAGYRELADACALATSETSNPYTLRGTVTRSVDGVTYIQRVNQSTHELDSIKLLNSSTYTSGKVLDISGGTLKTVGGVPCLDLQGASVNEAFNVNPTGYEPLVYNDVATFSNTAFSRDTYNYSHFVELDNVTVFLQSDNLIATVADANDNTSRVNILSGSASIASNIDTYYLQDSVLNIKGILEKNGEDNILKIVSSSDIEIASSPLRNPQNTPILHAFNWSVNNTIAQLETIRDNGFKTIQLSPMQPSKDYNSNDQWTYWWKLYQPLGFVASYGDNQSLIGVQSQLKNLTSQAKEMGINVIMDVVCNHLGGGDRTHMNSNTSYFEPDIYSQNLIHTTSMTVDDGNYKSIVQGQLGDYPDVQTENATVQGRIISMLKDYIDCGVTGFRFDAAKHIETPEDTYYSSNFWSNVLGQVTSYANSKYGFTPYYYGELLSVGNNRNWDWYTSRMSVTDSYRSQLAREAVTSGDVNKIDTNYVNNVSSNKVVIWAESHDNYAGEGHESTYISQDNINKIYAIQASREGAAPLYLARPASNSAKLGDSSTAYNNDVVRAVNTFHNEMVGASEYIYRNDGYFINFRTGYEKVGAVIVNVSNGSPSTIDLKVGGNYMIPDGDYTELISNTTVTVTNGTVNQKFSSNGVMVLMKRIGTEYGLKINGTPLAAVRVGEFDGFTQYKIANHRFHKDELISLYNYSTKDSWIVDIDEYSCEHNVGEYLTTVGSNYKVLKDFTSDVYIKLKYQQDQIYFGLTQLSLDKNTVNIAVEESDTVIATNACGPLTVTSANNSIATVRTEGTSIIISGVSAGETTVSVSDGDTTKNITVRVGASNVVINLSLGGWSSDYAVIFAWVWGDGFNSQWVKANGSTLTVPSGVNGLILLRMPSGSSEANWDTCWNRTNDIVYQSGKTLTFDSWDGGAEGRSTFIWVS